MGIQACSTPVTICVLHVACGSLATYVITHWAISGEGHAASPLTYLSHISGHFQLYVMWRLPQAAVASPCLPSAPLTVLVSVGLQELRCGHHKSHLPHLHPCSSRPIATLRDVTLTTRVQSQDQCWDFYFQQPSVGASCCSCALSTLPSSHCHFTQTPLKAAVSSSWLSQPHGPLHGELSVAVGVPAAHARKTKNLHVCDLSKLSLCAGMSSCTYIWPCLWSPTT